MTPVPSSSICSELKRDCQVHTAFLKSQGLKTETSEEVKQPRAAELKSKPRQIAPKAWLLSLDGAVHYPCAQLLTAVTLWRSPYSSPPAWYCGESRRFQNVALFYFTELVFGFRYLHSYHSQAVCSLLRSSLSLCNFITIKQF